MPKTVTPPGFPPSGSNFAQGIVHGPTSRRLIISGQVGVRPDGSVPEGLEAQVAQTFDNLLAVLHAAGFATTDLVRIGVFATPPDAVGPYRRIRDEKLAGHLVCATYLQVAGLASPAWLFEVEGEAVQEV
ncbi:MAG: RidA family protein [Bosea sp. (in: a-proteobacteria)]